MYMQVHFDDEAPRIGSGNRIVFVERDGHKWVTIRCPFTHASQKISKSVWDKLLRRSKAAEVRKRIVRQTAKEHGREKTDATKAMMRSCS